MSRFNALLIGTIPDVRPAVVKALGKVFSSNFVFEVGELPEAEKLLNKLHIDLLIIDVDRLKPDFLALDQLYPNTMFVGISSFPRNVDLPMNAFKHRMFAKNDFIASLTAELKTLRKNVELPEDKARKQKVSRPAQATEFADFSALVKLR